MATWSQVVRRITAHAHAVNALCYHDCGALVSASWDGTVRLWDLRTNSSKGRGYAAAVQVGAAVLSCATHGADVFCGLHDHSVAAIDLRAGARRATFSGHTGYVTALEATGAHVLSASQDGTVRIIDTRTGAGRELLRTHAPCFSLYHRADGARRWIVSGHADGVIRLSDAISGETLTEYGAGGEAAGTVFSLVAWHDGLLVAGSSDGTVRCFGQRPCDRDTHAATALQTAWRGHSSRKAPPLSAPSSPKPRSPLSLDPLPQLDSETPLKDSLEGLSLAEQTPALAVESPATRAESPASSALESPASSAEAGVKGRIKGGGFVATEGVSQKLLRAMGRKSSTASRTATTAPPPEGAVSGALKGGKTAARAAAVESSRAAASAVSGRAQALR